MVGSALRRATRRKSRKAKQSSPTTRTIQAPVRSNAYTHVHFLSQNDSEVGRGERDFCRYYYFITENGVPSEKVGTVAREASINLCVSTTYENI
mmetsp:Transcript_2178/g.5149  ORF Transcript_2178/g.5149 Transcript_2178/m.5149 type:complete len:94 (-) Transcript_2178:666-947(-)